MSGINRLIGPRDGAPRSNRIAAIVGVGVGVSLFFGLPFALGTLRSEMTWVLAWAMLWSPAFCLIPHEPRAGEAGQVARFLGAFLVTALANMAVFALIYLAGRML